MLDSLLRLSGEAAAPWIDAGYAGHRARCLTASVLELRHATRHPLLHLQVEGLAEEPPLQAQPALMPSSSALRCMSSLGRSGSKCSPVALSGIAENRAAGWWLWICTRLAPLLRLPQQLFCALFETETATALLEDDLPAQLAAARLPPRWSKSCFGRGEPCSASQQGAPIAACWRELGSCHELGSNISR